jgi:hypothetical protein
MGDRRLGKGCLKLGEKSDACNHYAWEVASREVVVTPELMLFI